MPCFHTMCHSMVIHTPELMPMAGKVKRQWKMPERQGYVILFCTTAVVFINLLYSMFKFMLNYIILLLNFI